MCVEPVGDFANPTGRLVRKIGHRARTRQLFEAIEPSSEAQPFSLSASADCWLLTWPRSSDRVWSIRLLA